MLKYIWNLPLDLIEWIIFNLIILSGGKIKWLNSIAIKMNLIEDNMLNMLLDEEEDDDIDNNE